MTPAALDCRPIWLVRHAPTTWTGRRWCGRSDPELSVAGRAEAARIAAEVAATLAAEAESPAGLAVPAAHAIILTSPLRRAVRTAELIADALGAPLELEPTLVEVDFGVADGLTWAELDARQPALAEAVLAGRDVDWPGGETAADVRRRSRRAAEGLLDRARTRTVFAVSHGGLLRGLAPLLGADPGSAVLDPATALRINPVRVR